MRLTQVSVRIDAYRALHCSRFTVNRTANISVQRPLETKEGLLAEMFACNIYCEFVMAKEHHTIYYPA